MTFYTIENVTVNTVTTMVCIVIVLAISYSKLYNSVFLFVSIFWYPHATLNTWNNIIPPLVERGLYCNHLVCPFRLSVCSHFRNRYLSFYWKKWFYIWYMALAWWLVPCLPFPGLPHIYFLFTVRLTNERVGIFLAQRSVQHLVYYSITPSSSHEKSLFLTFQISDALRQ